MLFGVDIRDVWEGYEDAAVVVSYLPHVYFHERSITRARLSSGADSPPPDPDPRRAPTGSHEQDWAGWYGYGLQEQMLAMLTDIQASKGAGKRIEAGYRPEQVSVARPQTAEDAYAQLMSWGA